MPPTGSRGGSSSISSTSRPRTGTSCACSPPTGEGWSFPRPPSPIWTSGPVELWANGNVSACIEKLVAVGQKAARFDMRECFDPAEPLRAVGPEGAGHVCPLSFGGTLVGTIAVGRRSGDFPLGRLQDEVIRTFAEFLAIQTLNLRRQREEVRRPRDQSASSRSRRTYSTFSCRAPFPSCPASAWRADGRAPARSGVISTTPSPSATSRSS
jgi:hypothetical protein